MLPHVLQLQCLPPELVGLVIQQLSNPRDLARAGRVCKLWNAHVADSTAWGKILPTLDPLFRLGPDGMRKLRCRHGSWAAVASLLARRAVCVGCAGSLEKKFGLLSCTGAGRTGDGGSRSCGTPTIAPNRWIFRERKPGSTPDLVGNGCTCSGEALARTVRAASSYATITLSGCFKLSEPLMLERPIRLVGGDQGATLYLVCCFVDVSSMGVLLENLRIYTTYDHAAVKWHQTMTGCSEEDVECAYCDRMIFAQTEEYISPAIEVCSRGGLIGIDLRVTSTIGSAVMLEAGGSAALSGCVVSSMLEDCDITMCLGVIAKSNATLSLHNCILERARWGVFAGADGDLLAAGNVFCGNEEADITTTLYEYSHQRVQPWTKTPLIITG